MLLRDMKQSKGVLLNSMQSPLTVEEHTRKMNGTEHILFV